MTFGARRCRHGVRLRPSSSLKAPACRTLFLRTLPTPTNTKRRGKDSRPGPARDFVACRSRRGSPRRGGSGRPQVESDEEPLPERGAGRRRNSASRACPRFRSLERNAAESLGTPGRTRTCDQWIRNPLLYPAELRAQETQTRKKTGAVYETGRIEATAEHVPRRFGAVLRCLSRWME